MNKHHHWPWASSSASARSTVGGGCAAGFRGACGCSRCLCLSFASAKRTWAETSSSAAARRFPFWPVKPEAAQTTNLQICEHHPTEETSVLFLRRLPVFARLVQIRKVLLSSGRKEYYQSCSGNWGDGDLVLKFHIKGFRFHLRFGTFGDYCHSSILLTIVLHLERRPNDYFSFLDNLGQWNIYSWLYVTLYMAFHFFVFNLQK